MPNFMKILLALALGLVVAPAMSACSGTEPAGAQEPAGAGAVAVAVEGAGAGAGQMLVHKHPSCGCCVLWVDHMQAAGFAVDVRDHEDMGPVKQRVGVPYAKGSCHTAEVDGYFIEGHVPAEDVKRLLAERPDARGLTVPGMPAGSPGMELPDGTVHPYVVELVHRDGTTSVWSRHGE